MDYQLFFVRPAGARLQRGVTRVFRVLEQGILVHTPLSQATTGLVPPAISYDNISNILCSKDDPSEFSFDVYDFARGRETVKYSCDTRTALLTAMLNRIDDINFIGTEFNVKKRSNQRGGFVDTVLRVRSVSIVKMVVSGARHDKRKTIAKRINLGDVLKLETLVDDPTIVLVHLKSRVMQLQMTDSVPFLTAVQRNIKTYLGVEMEVQNISTAALINALAARNQRLKGSPILYEFGALKTSLDANGRSQERERTLLITTDHLIELAGDEVVGSHNLSDIMGIVVEEKNDTEVTMEFRSWRSTHYHILERDAFVASMADVMNLSKGSHFSIRHEPFLPHTLPDKPLKLYQNELENFLLMKFMNAYGSPSREPSVWFPVLKDYACNMQVGDSHCIDARVVAAVIDMIKESIARGHGNSIIVTCLLVVQRLLASRDCFDGIRSVPDLPAVLFQCMRMPDAAVSYVASVAVRGAIKFAQVDAQTDAKLQAQESVNKMFVLNFENLQQLGALLHTHAFLNQNALQVLGILEILTLALTIPPADNDADRNWFKVLEASVMVAADVLCAICRSRSAVVFRSNSALLRALLLKASPIVANHIQKVCLARCVVLVHLRNALFSKNERTRLLSGNIVYLMMEGNRETKKLIDNILPKGVSGLHVSKVAAKKISGDKDARAVLLTAWLQTLEALRRETLTLPTLIWNDLKRKELHKFLRTEVEAFDEAAVASQDVMYNSADAQIRYSAASEHKGTMLHGVHLELLVEHTSDVEHPYGTEWKLREPVVLFQMLVQALTLGFTPLHATKCLPEVDLRLAVSAMAWIYERHADELAATVEALQVVELLLAMLRESLENDQDVLAFKLAGFLYAAMEVGARDNATRLVRAGGANIIVPAIATLLAKLCSDVTLMESDDAAASADGTPDVVALLGADGQSRLVRLPLGGQDSRESWPADSLEARDAVKWQDTALPTKIILSALLDLLDAALRACGSDSNLEQFPPSAVCTALCRDEVLCHLVQALLRARDPLYGRFLSVVAYLVKSNKSAASRLYKFGFFDILLWKLLAGQVGSRSRVATAQLLADTHLMQHPDALAHTSLTFRGALAEPGGVAGWGASILRLYLPDGLVVKLCSAAPEDFARVLEEERNAPDVVWNAEMAKRLLGQLAANLEFYVKGRAGDPLAIFVHAPKLPVAYPELADAVFAAPVYLHHYLDTERFPVWEMERPLDFHNSLVAELRKLADAAAASGGNPEKARVEPERLLLLLRAQMRVLRSHPGLRLPRDAEPLLVFVAGAALKACAAERDSAPESSCQVLEAVLWMLRRLLMPAGAAGSVRELEPLPLSTGNLALSVASLGVRGPTEGGFAAACPNLPLAAAVDAAFRLLEVMAQSAEGRRQLVEDERWGRALWWALCSGVGAMAAAERPAAVVFSALDCLSHLCTDGELLLEPVVKQGFHLPLLLLSIPPAEMRWMDEMEEAANGHVGQSLEELPSPKALMLAATGVLKSLARALEGAGGATPGPRQLQARSCLGCLIPQPLLATLKAGADGPTRFIAAAVRDITQPTAMWTSSVWAELRQRLTERVEQRNAAAAIGASLPADELDWLCDFRYECLKGQLVIGGVYINGYASGQWHNPEPPEKPEFLEALQDFLQENVALVASRAGGALGAPQAKSSGYTAADYATVLKALRTCVERSIADAREEVLRRIRYPLLAQLLQADGIQAAVQVDVAGIAGSLTRHSLTRDALLLSDLMGALAVLAWESRAAEGEAGVLEAALQALLAVSEEIPATAPATNSFGFHASLLLLLALLADVPLPALWREAPAGGPPGPAPAPLREMAARILGQVLLAGSGVSRRAQLLTDLQKRRSSGSTPEGGQQLSGSEEVLSDGACGDAADMFGIMSALEGGSLPGSPPGSQELPVLRSLLLLLPLDLLSTLARDPAAAVALYDADTCASRLVWDAGTRALVAATLELEADKLAVAARKRGKNLGLPTWSLQRAQPVFLRYVLCPQPREEETQAALPLFSPEAAPGYAREMYLGGFYLDQFLRHPEFNLGTELEDRFLRELRKAVVTAAPTDGAKGKSVTFEERRRFLLALLLLYKSRPQLLATQASIDIFLPIHDFISGGSGEERRGLCQAALLLFQCLANSEDMADLMNTEELMYTIGGLLSLPVPPEAAGDCATDPRMCSLALLLRLVRLSTKVLHVAMKLGVVSRLADIVVHMEGAQALREKAIQVLAAMCADKRRGAEVSRLLERLVPSSSPAYGSWALPAASISDELVDSRTLAHLLSSGSPAAWWSTDEVDMYQFPNVDPEAPAAVLEATLLFPKARLVDMREETEGAIRRSLSAAARVEPSEVILARKRGAAVSVEAQVNFVRSKSEGAREPAEAAAELRQLLEADPAAIFTAKLLEPFGAPRVTTLSIRAAALNELAQAMSLSRRNSTASMESAAEASGAAAAEERATDSPRTPSFGNGATFFGLGMSPTAVPRAFAAGVSSLRGLVSPSFRPQAGGPPPLPMPPAPRPAAASPEPAAGPGIRVQTEDGRVLPLAAGLELVLDGAALTEASKSAAKANFLEAFEEDDEELARMVERYPKLLQGFPLKPQLCYEVACAWEENCLDLLTPEETAKYQKTIAAVDMCRVEDVEQAGEEAKKKYASILEIRREKELKALGEAAKEVKQDPELEVAEGEIKGMTKGKIQKKKKGTTTQSSDSGS